MGTSIGRNKFLRPVTGSALLATRLGITKTLVRKSTSTSSFTYDARQLPAVNHLAAAIYRP